MLFGRLVVVICQTVVSRQSCAVILDFTFSVAKPDSCRAAPCSGGEVRGGEGILGASGAERAAGRECEKCSTIEIPSQEKTKKSAPRFPSLEFGAGTTGNRVRIDGNTTLAAIAYGSKTHAQEHAQEYAQQEAHWASGVAACGNRALFVRERSNGPPPRPLVPLQSRHRVATRDLLFSSRSTTPKKKKGMPFTKDL